MHPTVREFYNLEEVWGGKPVKVASPAAAKKSARGKASRPRRKR
jgi:hypothetical protein